MRRAVLAQQISTIPTMTDDPAFRRSMLAVRWLLLALWVSLGAIGVQDVSTTALVVSSLIIGAYNVALTVLALALRRDTGLDRVVITVSRYLDIVAVTTGLIALHDVRNPVWVVYLIGIVGAAHFLGRGKLGLYVAWAAANYMAFALITWANGHDVSWGYVTVALVVLGLMGMTAAMFAGGEQRVREIIHRAAITDALTGLPNRHYFHARYTMSMDEAAEKQLPLALMLLDVDHFKEINDRFGHRAGDEKLRAVARSLESAVRETDLVARYGGDEFIVVASGTTRGDALDLAERLRTAVAECETSVSVGVATYPEDGLQQDALIQAADAALYEAKQAGRNRVRESLAAA